MTKTTESIARAKEIRALLTQGLSPAEIAKRTGSTVASVYGVRAYDRKKANLAAQKPKKAGRPKGSKTKPKMAVRRDVFKGMQQELNELRNENIRLTVEAATGRPPMYVEMPVPQPFSQYTFLQRLRILFLGRAA